MQVLTAAQWRCWVQIQTGRSWNLLLHLPFLPPQNPHQVPQTSLTPLPSHGLLAGVRHDQEEEGSISIARDYFFPTLKLSLTNQIYSLNLESGSVTAGIRFLSICQLGLCQRLAFNF